jgi:hypothetical protein
LGIVSQWRCISFSLGSLSLLKIVILHEIWQKMMKRFVFQAEMQGQDYFIMFLLKPKKMIVKLLLGDKMYVAEDGIFNSLFLQ